MNQIKLNHQKNKIDCINKIEYKKLKKKVIKIINYL